ncbi:MAG: glycosyltransferase family protein, partial [Hyphomicrobiaceae bacterium]
LLFYVLHLQGIGHVVRSSRICAALAEDGHDVTLVLGGMPIEGFSAGRARTVQLPPLRMSPESYRVLLKEDGTPLDDAYRALRRDQLMAELDRARPDVVMFEAFPFDRPQMHFEILPFIEAARTRTPRPLIVSSIRDILHFKDKAERDAKALEHVKAYFDKVLIHGDPRLATLDMTFRHADEIADMVHYTGIVTPPAEPAFTPTQYDVIVTAGGGATGEALLKAAIAAKPETALADANWVATLGPHIPPDAAREVIRLGAEQNIEIVPFLPDLMRHLAGAKLSISQAGYNTGADLLRAHCRAVMCPFSGARQNEQARRAELFAEHGLAIMVPEAELSPASLRTAIGEALAMPPDRLQLDLDGAANTARILGELIAADVG